MWKQCGDPKWTLNFTIPCYRTSPSSKNTWKTKAQQGWEWQISTADQLGTGQVLKAEKPGLLGTDTPPPYPMEQVLPKTPASLRSGKPAAEELQPNPKNKHRRTHKKGQPQVKGHQKHQHFTAAQNLTRHGRHHGTTTAPARDGSRKGRRVSHFRYNCKRYQRGCLRLARGLAFFFFLFCLF